MPTYLLTWNEKRAFFDIERQIKEIADGKRQIRDWSSGNTLAIRAGDRIFFLRQGSERGILASGYATTNGYRAPHWDYGREDDFAKYIDYELDVVVPVEDRLPTEELAKAPLKISWRNIFASGYRVPSESEELLEEMWREHLINLGKELEFKDESLEVELPSRFTEGAVRRVWVNTYERSTEARVKCVEHWGADCAVCNFNFGKAYGEIGEGYIHVHHLRELSTIKAEYELDAIEDLRPVCPNCHAMLHSRRPALSIEELRGILLS